MTAKPYRIEWRPMAREDLRAIVRYIGKDNPTRAKSFGQGLRDKTKPLAQHPEIGRQGRPGAPDWLRELIVHPNHIVFYHVLVEAHTVRNSESETRGAENTVRTPLRFNHCF